MLVTLLLKTYIATPHAGTHHAGMKERRTATGFALHGALEAVEEPAGAADG